MPPSKRKATPAASEVDVKHISDCESGQTQAQPTMKKVKVAAKSSTLAMKIVSAIRSLKNCNGSSLPAIAKFLQTEYNYDNPTALKKSLKKEVENGTLTKNKASYLVSGDAAYEDLSEKVTVEDLKLGPDDSSQVVLAHDTCTISYVGSLEETGVVFDSSKCFSFTLGNGEVIKGMEAIQGMRVGGKRRLIVPATLAYGARGSSPDIPPNSVLRFEIRLLKIA